MNGGLLKNAMFKCLAALKKEQPVSQAAEVKVEIKEKGSGILAKSWPGSLRGWGPITSELKDVFGK